MIRKFHQILYLIPLMMLIIIGDLSAQVGNVTGISLSGNTLSLQCGNDLVVFKVCTENVIMVNLRPNGIESPDTLIIGNTTWTQVPASIDTSSDPIRITTSNYKIEINKYPLRFHAYNNSGELLCYEPNLMGINPAGISLTTTGGNFYGIHNHKEGVLHAMSGNVFAGLQGDAGAPFIWTTKGWGILADMESGSIDYTTNSINLVRYSSQKIDIEVYLLFGSPKEIMNGMTDVTGKPPLFPKYTLGFLNSQWGIDQASLFSYVNTYRAKGIPIDAYILDFDWMNWGENYYGEFTFGPKFPLAPGGLLKDSLLKSGIKLIGIRKPRIHVNTQQGQYAQSQNYFVDYTIDYFSGKQVGRLNFNKPDARQWFWASFYHQGDAYNNGIIAYWNDEADEYGNNFNFMQMQRSFYEGQRQSNNKRVWSLNRNYFLGAQRYAYGHWSGDISTGFTSMAAQPVFMNSSILLGSSWWSMDIGGYYGTPNSENYFRWIQFGAFVPIFRVHGTYNEQREPWFYGSEAEQIATQYIKLRYRLLPYIYTAAWENHQTGLSITRPLLLEYPNDLNTVDLSDQWMFGDNMLVKPVLTEGVSSVPVYLPEGKWIDYWNGNNYTGPTNINYPVDHSTIPLFVKAGSVIPAAPVGRFSNDSLMQSLLILSCYNGAGGNGFVYDDDGETYQYENGSYAITNFQQLQNNTYTDLNIDARTGSFTPSSRDYLAEFNFMKSTPDSVKLNNLLLSRSSSPAVLNTSLTAWAYDTLNTKCYVRLHDNGQQNSIRVFWNNSTGITKNIMPSSFALYQNYPNPFNPSTTIKFSLPERLLVTIKVYDILGKEISVLMNEEKDAGIWYTSFNASDYANGVYFCRIQAGKYNSVIKMILLK